MDEIKAEELLQQELSRRGLSECSQAYQVLIADGRNTGKGVAVENDYQSMLRHFSEKLTRKVTNVSVPYSSVKNIVEGEPVVNRDYAMKLMDSDLYRNGDPETHKKVGLIFQKITEAEAMAENADQAESLRTQSLLREQAKTKKKSGGILDL